MLNSAFKNAFIDNFPGFLSIRDSQHKIVFINENLQKWLGKFIDVNIIGLTNKEVKLLVDNPHMAEVFDEANDLSIDEIKSGNKKNRVIKFYDDGKDSFFDLYKFTKEVEGESYIFTMATNITKSYKEVKFFKEKSQIDPLTGSYNRSILDSMSPSEESVFIYFDIDNFKYVNDSFGHATGDNVLCAIVEIIERNSRKDDVLVRMGGDEFLLIMDDIKVEKVMEIVNKIGATVKNEVSKKYKKLSLSHGVQRYLGTIDETFQEVDKKMYKNKQEKKLKLRNEREFMWKSENSFTHNHAGRSETR